MERIRTPFQGVWNIVRFNWHLYALAIALLTLTLFAIPYLPGTLAAIAIAGCCAILLSLSVSLIVSHYIYDRSSLYQLNFIDGISVTGYDSLVNIHAGFDETSVLLQDKYPGAHLSVFDFYDPAKHTEISIKRARKAWPAFTGTQQITTGKLPLQDRSVHVIFLLFAAHEIRNDAERIAFFQELQRVLQPGGRIVITEHLRDLPNFLAYNIGFFHFLPRSVWMNTFSRSGFTTAQEIKTTPFITTFILQYGTTP